MTAVEEFPARGPIGRFRDGLLLLSEGFGFLRRQARLWPLAIIPVLFALVFVGLVGSVFWIHLDGIHEVCAAWLPMLEAEAWWAWIWVGPGKLLFWLLGWLAVVVSFALSLVAALLLANLVSAPFLDHLSQRVEAIALGDHAPSESGSSSILSDALRSFAAEFQRLVFLAGIWLILSAVGFILPGAHLVTGPILIAVTVLLLPLDYAGFALDRRQISFRSRRSWLWQNLPTMGGFGGVAFVACLVPGLNLLMMPALVTAGTLLVLRTAPVEASRPVGTPS
jgi:CysZ protein